MISLRLKEAEARERTILWALGEDVEFPEVQIYSKLFYCDCGRKMKWSNFGSSEGYYWCDCE